MELLRIENLKTHFYTYKGIVKAVDGINLEIMNDEIFGLVGESGCGKSVTALSILKLLSPPGKIVEGKIIFEGLDLVKLKDKDMRALRGSKIAMIFQEPMSSLNPVYTIGYQLVETILLHKNDINKKQARERALQMLKLVRIPSAEKVIDQYPHELSGGMRQRVMIAIALACKPKLLIADEPTTALDVTTESQILELIKELKSELHHSVLLITHDLGIIAETCDRVAVMYAGKIVECSNVETIFKAPKHPYTVGLLNAVPKFRGTKTRLEVIEGSPPDLISITKGCRFAPRCKFANSKCKESEPELRAVEEGHEVACFKC